MSKAEQLVAVGDDEKSVGRPLDRLLRSAGFNVERFESGSEFLRSLQDHTPDYVVLDLQMPEVDGFQVQSRLVQTSVPVLIFFARVP
jgi:FixJ family two-component response regulator